MSSIPNPSTSITSEESEVASEQLKKLMKNEQKRGNPKLRHTPEQIQILMDTFKENQNPDMTTLTNLADQTNLKLKQIKVRYYSKTRHDFCFFSNVCFIIYYFFFEELVYQHQSSEWKIQKNEEKTSIFTI